MSYDLLFFFFQTFLSESFIAFITSVLNIGKLKLKNTHKNIAVRQTHVQKNSDFKKTLFLN